jgi:uncharacterized protein
MRTSETDTQLIEKTVDYVKKTLADAEGGHDWWHTYRVWKAAEIIAVEESTDATIVALAALLHDIADAKFHDGDETIGPDKARCFLQSMNANDTLIDDVVNIIKHMSFKNSLDGETGCSAEMRVLQDADRLDAIGAIGIARAFSYGGFKGRVFYDPAIPPQLNMDKETYKKSTAPTINHFYEKLLLLKDGMHTHTAKAMAAERHAYMEGFLKQFFAEWEGRV